MKPAHKLSPKEKQEIHEALWSKIRSEVPIPEGKYKTSIENARITAQWKAQINKPYTKVVSKRSSKQSKAGFTKGMYVSQRCCPILGTPIQDVPFPDY